MAILLTWNDGEDILRFDVVTNEHGDNNATPTSFPIENGSPITDHVDAANPIITFDAFISNQPIRPGDYGGEYRNVKLDFAYQVVQEANTFKVEPPKQRKIPGPLDVGGIIRAIGNELSSGSFEFTGKKATITLPSIDARVLIFDRQFDLRREYYEKLETLRQSATLIEVSTPLRTVADCVITKLAPARTKETGDGVTFSIELQQISIVETKLVPPPRPTEPRAQVKAVKGTQKGGILGTKSVLTLIAGATGWNPALRTVVQP